MTTAAKNRGLRVTISIGALLVAIVYHITQFQLDVPTIVLLVVAAIPWIQPLFKAVELLRVKFELQDLDHHLSWASDMYTKHPFVMLRRRFGSPEIDNPLEAEGRT